jgi:hypothetical protein
MQGDKNETKRRRALLIATDTYSDHTFRQLRTPRADAEALAALLADEKIGGYEVLPIVHNGEASVVSLAVEDFLADAHRDDLLLLYISGHGIKDDAGRLYLPTTNSRNNRLASTAISAQFIRERMEYSRSRRILVLLDCCYAGAFPPGVMHRADEKVDVLGQLAGRGIAVMTSSSALEYAYEVTEDTSSPVFGRDGSSIFTGVLIDGLRSGAADLDGDGLIDVDELYDYVYEEIRRTTPRPWQTPTLDNSKIEGKLFVATSVRGKRPDVKSRPDLAPLRPGLFEAVSNPLPTVRVAVISELVELGNSEDSTVATSARKLLKQLADDQYPGVARAASGAMRSLRQLEPEPEADVEIKIAKVFDSYDTDGKASIGPLRSKLADDVERSQVVSYLNNGAPVLTTTGRDRDRVSPQRGQVVPMSFRTDGVWVWSQALAYYAETYGYAPETEFLEHIRKRGFRVPAEVSEELRRAASKTVLGR